jgi:hypothetical protein
LVGGCGNIIFFFVNVDPQPAASPKAERAGEIERGEELQSCMIDVHSIHSMTDFAELKRAANMLDGNISVSTEA